MAAPESAGPVDAIDRLFRSRDGRKPPAVGVAVSGGGDSLALLFAATEWMAKSGAGLRAATVDHGLRPEAAQEARQVATICAGLGIPHETLPVTLADGPDLQARARTARYGALRAWAGRHSLSPVLIGHTRDDVAETLVMRLRRGAGIDGLAEMAAEQVDATGQVWARPFLSVGRSELRTFLAERDVAPIEDPSNDDTRFERVAVRQAMTALGLDTGMLARSAAHLAEALRSCEARAADLAATIFTEDRGDLLMRIADLPRLRREEPDSLRRLALAALAWVGRGPVPRRHEMDGLMRALRGDMPARTLAGCRVSTEKADGCIRFAREAAATGPPVPVDGIWDGRWRVTGPSSPELRVGALGDDVASTPWRETGLPHASLRASPAIRRGDDLVAAPLAGMASQYHATVSPAFDATLRPRSTFFN